MVLIYIKPFTVVMYGEEWNYKKKTHHFLLTITFHKDHIF